MNQNTGDKISDFDFRFRDFGPNGGSNCLSHRTTGTRMPECQ